MPVLGTGAGAGANTSATANTGAAPVTGAIAGMLGSGTWRQQIGAYLWGEAAPQLGQYGLQGALGNYSLNMSPFGLAATGAEAQTQAGFTFAKAMLGYKGLGLESQTLARQMATAGATQGLEQTAYGVTSQRYGQESATATLSYRNRQLGMQSQMAASGTLDTAGSQMAQETAAQQYAWQQATIFRAQQLAQLGQQREQLGYRTKAGGLASAQAQLGLAAQGQGLDVQQAQSQLAFGLGQLGIKATPLALLSQITQAQGGAATTLRGVLSAGSLIGGLGPTFGQGG